MKKCIACSYINPESEKHCLYCHEQLEDKTKFTVDKKWRSIRSQVFTNEGKSIFAYCKKVSYDGENNIGYIMLFPNMIEEYEELMDKFINENFSYEVPSTEFVTEIKDKFNFD